MDALAKLDKARTALAESRTLSEVKQIRNIAEAARVYAKAAHLGRESQNYAAEISLLASRKAGEILKQLQKNKSSGVPASVAGTSEYAKTLMDTETPERTARYWQRLADIPEGKVTEYLDQAKQHGEEISTSAFVKRASMMPKKSKSKSTPSVPVDPKELEALFGDMDAKVRQHRVSKEHTDYSLHLTFTGLTAAQVVAIARAIGGRNKPEYDTESRDYPVTTPLSLS